MAELKTASGDPAGRLAFGCFALSGGYGSAAGVDARVLIQTALDLGINVLDTSDAYAAGRNETVVGEAIAGVRDEVFLTTKFGWVLDSLGTPVRRDSSPEHVRRACEASLRRLGTDYIDLYLQHRRDPETPVEATVDALVRLRDAGKIRAYGFCEVGSATLDRASRVWQVAALQTEYSLWSREPERELLPVCVDRGIAFMAYSPLGRGFLTGTIRSTAELEQTDFRRGHPRFQDDNVKANLGYVDRLSEIARRRGLSAAQLALAWLMSRPWPVLPIVATRTRAHLVENSRAMSLELTPAELEEIGEAVPPAMIRGERHPAAHMETIET
jgi:aryl-alcohol dehydrogenase-like predicted oxidoreductase